MSQLKHNIPLNESNSIALTNDNSLKHYDAIIAGGGLSGCLMAVSLLQAAQSQNRNVSIAIIESVNKLTTPNNNQPNAFDERVIALSHSTVCYLKSLNLWSYLADKATPIHTIHISDKNYYGKARVYAHENQVDALGYVAEMKHIGESFIQGITQQLKENTTGSTVDWYCPDNIQNIVWHKEIVNVTLSSNKQLSASLLLACDGAKSVCREFAGISRTTKSYEQSAVITNVRMKGISSASTQSTSKEHIAYERFSENGPIAMLPLCDDRYSLVWTVSAEQVQQLEEYNDEEFKQAINKAFGFWQGGVIDVGKRTVFPLHLVQAETNIYHRMALIGNASHTIHPIAGQGFNLGVRDIQQLTTLIAKQLKGGENSSTTKQIDIGTFAVLNAYELQRQQDQQYIINMTDSLVNIFSNTYTPLVAGRNIALKAMNYLTPIKKRFVKKSMGY